jgi:glutamate dehydrogenase (NADP+)
VAIYTIEKLYELGAKPITCSDSSGTVHDPRGIDLETLKRLKEVERAPLTQYVELHSEATYVAREDYPTDGHAVWRINADAAFPCATQNELTLADATADAVNHFIDARIAYGPGKAANAGGVATSQLEMAQNSSMEQWSLEKVDDKLQAIMTNIHQSCANTAAEFDEPHNLVLGANIAGFRKVADAMIEQGVC